MEQKKNHPKPTLLSKLYVSSIAASLLPSSVSAPNTSHPSQVYISLFNNMLNTYLYIYICGLHTKQVQFSHNHICIERLLPKMFHFILNIYKDINVHIQNCTDLLLCLCVQIGKQMPLVLCGSQNGGCGCYIFCLQHCSRQQRHVRSVGGDS